MKKTVDAGKSISNREIKEGQLVRFVCNGAGVEKTGIVRNIIVNAPLLCVSSDNVTHQLHMQHDITGVVFQLMLPGVELVK